MRLTERLERLEKTMKPTVKPMMVMCYGRSPNAAEVAAFRTAYAANPDGRLAMVDGRVELNPVPPVPAAVERLLWITERRAQVMATLNGISVNDI